MYIISVFVYISVLWSSWVAFGEVALEFNKDTGVCIYTFDYGKKLAHFILMTMPNILCIFTVATNVGLWMIFKETSKKQSGVRAITLRMRQQSIEQTTLRVKQQSTEQTMSTAATANDNYINRSVKKKMETVRAILTTCIISVLFIIAWIPIAIRYTISAYPWENKRAPAYLDKIIIFTFNVTTWCNPIVYTVINKSFRDFVLRRFTYQVRVLAASTATSVTEQKAF